MKKRFLVVLGLSVVLLVSCTDAEYFSELHSVHHVEVVDTGTTMIGKASYPTITYISNKTGKKVKRRFSSSEDYGFRDYYETAELYKTDDTYIDIVLDEDNNMVSVVLSKEE